MARTVLTMDFDWRFHRGDLADESANSHANSYTTCKSGAVIGGGAKSYHDSNWRLVDLPHDYFSESDFSPENLLSHGYRTRDNAWYRKTFLLDPSFADKELFLCFEGTAVHADFYFNGSLMARSFSAYTETVFDITDRACCDGNPNTLAVYIKGFETEGWWYEGAGIYRHVRLYVKDKLHIAHNGIFGKPVLRPGTRNSWTVDVETTVENSYYEAVRASVRAALYDGDRKICECDSREFVCEADGKTAVMQKLSVSRPVRWDVDCPKLYTLRVSVLRDGIVTDEAEERIGFRTIAADPERGFLLNGRPLKLKGTCNHQDHAGVGVAIPDAVQYYRIRRLKEMGSNAYRCSHNLPAKEVLDACDALGLIVMDENRRFESREEVLDYLDIMVRRDRNHPCVAFWSLFNEEPLQNTEEGARIYRRMKSRVRKLDDSRLLTGAINGNMEGAGLEMDIVGINYNIDGIPAMHAKHPDLPVIGSENNSAVTTRGCYRSDREGAQVLANYDEEVVPWGQSIRRTWEFTRSHDYFAGIFVWTGFDYRGEPTPFTWPSVSSQFGILDTCGFPKDAFYFHQACFTDKPMVHLLPHWNWKPGDTVRVMAVSNCDEVELFLGARSLGRKPADPCAPPEWQVEFKPGRLLAKGYRKQKCVAKDERRTAEKPVAIRILPDRTEIQNDGQDTVVLNLCAVDRNGIPVPTASDLLRFSVEGDGYVRGVGNGDPNSHESDVLPQRHLYCGYCQALVTARRGAKQLLFRAAADGLEEASLSLSVIDVPAPLCPVVTTNYLISDGLTMSPVTDAKPDPLIPIADNDMNSFTPVHIAVSCHQKDFRNGWRIYRATPRIREAGHYFLRFAYARFDAAEIYANGVEIARTSQYTNGVFLTRDFSVADGERVDIRMLLHITDADEWGAGISDKVEMFEKR